MQFIKTDDLKIFYRKPDFDFCKSLKYSKFEKYVYDECKKEKEIKLYGYCKACNNYSSFVLVDNFINEEPNFREGLNCSKCHISMRNRFMLDILQNNVLKYPNNSLKIFMHEKITEFYALAYNTFTDHKIIGSEYLGDGIESGKVINGIRHENAESLSFENNSLDIIISNDVYEHVADINLALKEAYRVLKQDGLLLINVPFDFNGNDNIVRAKYDNDDNLINILEPIYHSGEYLVHHDFSWEFLELLKDVGFSDVFITTTYNPYNGYIGTEEFTLGFPYIIVAQK